VDLLAKPGMTEEELEELVGRLNAAQRSNYAVTDVKQYLRERGVSVPPASSASASSAPASINQSASASSVRPPYSNPRSHAEKLRKAQVPENEWVAWDLAQQTLKMTNDATRARYQTGLFKLASRGELANALTMSRAERAQSFEGIELSSLNYVVKRTPPAPSGTASGGAMGTSRSVRERSPRSDAGAPGPAKRIKREESPIQVPDDAMQNLGFVEQPRRYTDQTEFAQERPFFNVETGQWEKDPGQVVVVRHRMEQNDLLDHGVPFRDQTDPIHRVHRDFADHDGFLHPDVQFRGLTFASAQNFSNAYSLEAKSALSPDDRNLIRLDAETEMQLLMANSRRGAIQQPSALAQNTVVDQITEADGVAPWEDSLIGQSGLRARRDFEPGEFVGFYGGMLNADPEWLAAERPGYQDYAEF
jgi:hypothetical protein